MNTREGHNQLFIVAAQMKREKTDILASRFVKDEDENLLVEHSTVAERWMQHFNTLLNEDSDHQIEVCDIVSGPVEDITKKRLRQLSAR